MRENNFTAVSMGNYRVVCDVDNLCIHFECYDTLHKWRELNYSPFYLPLENEEQHKFYYCLTTLMRTKGTIATFHNNQRYFFTCKDNFIQCLIEVKDSLGDRANVEVQISTIPQIHIFSFFCKLAGFIPILIYPPVIDLETDTGASLESKTE